MGSIKTEVTMENHPRSSESDHRWATFSGSLGWNCSVSLFPLQIIKMTVSGLLPLFTHVKFKFVILKPTLLLRNYWKSLDVFQNLRNHSCAP